MTMAQVRRLHRRSKTMPHPILSVSLRRIAERGPVPMMAASVALCAAYSQSASECGSPARRLLDILQSGLKRRSMHYLIVWLTPV